MGSSEQVGVEFIHSVIYGLVLEIKLKIRMDSPLLDGPF